LNADLFGINTRDHLEFRGLDLTDLAEKYGTPLFIYDEMKIRENYRLFHETFRRYYPDVLIYYSCKASYNLALCRILQQEGAHAQVMSGLDLYVARRAGFPPESIVFDGPSKTDMELYEAVKQGVRLVNVESLSELERLNSIAGKLGVKQSIGIRLNFSRPPNNIFRRVIEGATSYHNSKYGFPREDANLACTHALSMSNLQLEGLMTHPYQGAAGPLAALAGRIFNQFKLPVRYLNLGGGFSVPHVKSIGFLDLLEDNLKGKIGLGSSLDEQKTNDLNEVAKSTIDELKSELQKYSLPMPVLAFEPGRFMVGSAGVLLLRVLDLKPSPYGGKWVLVDGTTSIFVAGYNERHRILVANRAGAKPVECVNIAGPLHGDLIAVKQFLPRVDRGDILAILDTGAYNLAMSRQYLHPRPCVLLVTVDGNVSVIRDRETREDVLRLDRDISERTKLTSSESPS